MRQRKKVCLTFIVDRVPAAELPESRLGRARESFAGDLASAPGPSAQVRSGRACGRPNTADNGRSRNDRKAPPFRALEWHWQIAPGARTPSPAIRWPPPNRVLAAKRAADRARPFRYPGSARTGAPKDRARACAKGRAPGLAPTRVVHHRQSDCRGKVAQGLREGLPHWAATRELPETP